MPTDPHHTPIIIQPSTSKPQLKQRSRKPKRKETMIPQPSGPTDNVVDEAVNEEMDDTLERAATTATSLDAEQDRGVLDVKSLKSEKSSEKANVVEEQSDNNNNTYTITTTNLLSNNNYSCLAQDPRQSIVDDDYQMAQQIQAEEQEKLSIEEKSKLFVQLLEARKKHFAVMRAQEMRNKPPTKAQKRNKMSTYLEVRAEGSATRVKGSSKRAGEELEQERSKKQKLEDDKEIAELQRLIEVVPDKEEVAIDAIPLATKPPSIVDYKIHKEGKKTYYQIIRADGSLKMYLVFSHMLKSFDREDFKTLWKLVKAMHGSTRPEDGYERVL
ncbi:hypothetical protein Tco_0065749 [Tanacetum coccineum]